MGEKLKPSSSSHCELQARPVLEASGPPCYPTRAGRLGKTASGAATFFLAITIGGGVESQGMEESVNPPAVTQQVEQSSNSTQQQNQGTIVAPIFVYGEGRGSTGCMAVAPPAFLSEDDAMQIIKEELGKHGFKLGKGGDLEGVEMQMLVPNIYEFKEEEGKKLETPVTLHADGIEFAKGVAIEFVSKLDLDVLRDKYFQEKLKRRDFSFHTSSGRFYDTKKMAEYLAKEAKGKGNKKIYLGVFYDPAERNTSLLDSLREKWKAIEEGREIPKKKEKPMTWEEREEHTRNESKKKLRQQVSDFADWLGEQGVEVSTKDQ